jgi:hypothetical protein
MKFIDRWLLVPPVIVLPQLENLLVEKADYEHNILQVASYLSVIVHRGLDTIKETYGHHFVDYFRAISNVLAKHVLFL